MVALWVGGKKIEWADAVKALTEAGQAVLRNDAVTHRTARGHAVRANRGRSPIRARGAGPRRLPVTADGPRARGELRGESFRLQYEDVLGVLCHINENALRVEVLFAGPSRRR